MRHLLYRALQRFIGRNLYFLIVGGWHRQLKTLELASVWLFAQRLYQQAPRSLTSLHRLQTYPWRYGALVLYSSVSLREPQLLVE